MAYRPLILQWLALALLLAVASASATDMPPANPLQLAERALPRVCEGNATLRRLASSPDMKPASAADCKSLLSSLQRTDDDGDGNTRRPYVYKVPSAGVGVNAVKAGSCSIVLSPAAGPAAAGKLEFALAVGDLADILADAYDLMNTGGEEIAAYGSDWNCQDAEMKHIMVDWFVYNENRDEVKPLPLPASRGLSRGESKAKSKPRGGGGSGGSGVCTCKSSGSSYYGPVGAVAMTSIAILSLFLVDKLGELMRQ
ncbi:hypothetical protein RB594_009602 [Gaeumannomyces avenae]